VVAEVEDNNRVTRRIKIGMGLPWPLSSEVSWEYLDRQAKELREDFTPEKRDALFATIEHNGSDRYRAEAELQYYLTMLRVNSDEREAKQQTLVTWILALATVSLVAATAVLAYVTAVHH
jgi:hypothetical protein